jgi:hypothetical protein
MSNATDGLRRYYDNLNERERKLVGLLGLVLGLIVVVLPLYLLTHAIGQLEEENRDINAVLRDISRSRAKLQEREAEREASARRYARKAPPLGSFIEAKAQSQGLRVREVNDQPEKKIGDFTRRHTRVTLPNVGLKPVIEMMAAIENSPYPVAIERVRIEHFRSGDQYNVQLGVIAFDAEDAGKDKSKGRTASRRKRKGRTGPPAP